MNFKLVASWTAAFIVASLLFDWYAVAAVGGVGGWFLVGRKPFLTSAIAAGTAWWILLLVTATRGAVGSVAGLLGEIMGLPDVALYLSVGLFPALLAGSAATLTSAIRIGMKER
jgi:hypothetical protein